MVKNCRIRVVTSWAPETIYARFPEITILMENSIALNFFKNYWLLKKIHQTLDIALDPISRHLQVGVKKKKREKRKKKTMPAPRFSTHFLTSVNRVKHSLSCFIYYMMAYMMGYKFIISSGATSGTTRHGNQRWTGDTIIHWSNLKQQWVSS